jgi:hypothetical protein
MEVKGQLDAPAALTSGKDSRFPLARRLGGPTAGLGSVEKRKILSCRESNPGRLAHSPSLYRLLSRLLNSWNVIKIIGGALEKFAILFLENIWRYHTFRPGIFRFTGHWPSIGVPLNTGYEWNPISVQPFKVLPEHTSHHKNMQTCKCTDVQTAHEILYFRKWGAEMSVKILKSIFLKITLLSHAFYIYEKVKINESFRLLIGLL